MARHSILIAALAALALVACADDFGESCDMPDTPEFNALCSPDPESGTDATCVFTNSAQCSSRMCARFQGSRDFCTEACTAETADSCPGSAQCFVPPGTTEGFCVPESVAAGN